MANQSRVRQLSPIAHWSRQGFYKGVLGGDRKWLAVGIAVWTTGIVRRMIVRNEEVVTIERLEPGQWISLQTIPAQTRKERKATKAMNKRGGRRAKQHNA